jgi:large subunit ribosomal protein L29
MKRNDQLKDFRTMDLKTIEAEVRARKEELMKLRFQNAVGQAPNPAQIGSLRTEVARLMTIATEKRKSSLEKSLPKKVK